MAHFVNHYFTKSQKRFVGNVESYTFASWLQDESNHCFKLVTLPFGGVFFLSNTLHFGKKIEGIAANMLNVGAFLFLAKFWKDYLEFKTFLSTTLTEQPFHFRE